MDSLSRRWKRIKDTWTAFLFLLRGGSFAVSLEWDDPLTGPAVFRLRPGATIHVDREAAFAKSCTLDRLHAKGLEEATPGDPGAFLVKWRNTGKASA